MREYKLIAWLKKEKKMAEVLAIDFLSETILIHGVPTKTYIHTKELREDSDYLWICFDGVILMQHADVKDKNGIYIYECDIIIANRREFEHYKETNGIFKTENGYADKITLEELSPV